MIVYYTLTTTTHPYTHTHTQKKKKTKQDFQLRNWDLVTIFIIFLCECNSVHISIRVT